MTDWSTSIEYCLVVTFYIQYTLYSVKHWLDKTYSTRVFEWENFGKLSKCSFT